MNADTPLAHGGRSDWKLLVCTIVFLGTIVFVLIEIVLQLAMPAYAFRQSWTDDYWLAARKGNLCLEVAGDLEVDRALGWRMRRNHTADGVKHDAKGLRSVGEVASHGLPILAIGDSFTYGLGVADEETYSAQLARLAGRPAINAGVNAYGVDQAVLMFESLRAEVRPSAVVLGLFFDDFHRSALTVRDAPKPYFAVAQDGQLVRHEAKSCQDLAENVARLTSLRLPLLLQWTYRQIAERMTGPPVAMLEERARLNLALLDRLKAAVRESGAQLVVLLIPHCLNDGTYGDWILNRVSKDCDVVGIDCIDFSKLPKQGMYGRNCHWSPEGHRMAAAQIEQRLRPARD